LDQKIQFFNRSTKELETEKVYGDAFMRFFYSHAFGKKLIKILANKWSSEAYGQYQNLAITQKAVPSFVKNFNIKLSDFEPGSISHTDQSLSYKNFNEFFIRKLKLGARSVVQEKNLMPAFAEGRYVGFKSIVPSQVFPVKGEFLKAKELLEQPELAKIFEGGPLLIARLCPVDYHRYHFPDKGEKLDSYRVHGRYDSVSPIALKHKPDIFFKNERHITILKTENFGRLAYIEVGALCVGKIVQTHHSQKFLRGEEKGYFLFGGSTVILMGEKGAWQPSSDVLENTNKGIETFIQLGDSVAEVR
jgi:phosphatidylserine decarboxylase